MSPYANRINIAIHSAEIFGRTPTLESSRLELVVDTLPPLSRGSCGEA
jgi:hypothetical protein